MSDDYRAKARELLKTYVGQEISGRTLVAMWPEGYDDPLLDCIINALLEPIDPSDIVPTYHGKAEVGIEAIDSDWSPLQYSKAVAEGEKP